MIFAADLPFIRYDILIIFTKLYLINIQSFIALPVIMAYFNCKVDPCKINLKSTLVSGVHFDKQIYIQARFIP